MPAKPLLQYFIHHNFPLRFLQRLFVFGKTKLQTFDDYGYNQIWFRLFAHIIIDSYKMQCLDWRIRSRDERQLNNETYSVAAWEKIENSRFVSIANGRFTAFRNVQTFHLEAIQKPNMTKNTPPSYKHNVWNNVECVILSNPLNFWPSLKLYSLHSSNPTFGKNEREMTEVIESEGEKKHWKKSDDIFFYSLIFASFMVDVQSSLNDAFENGLSYKLYQPWPVNLFIWIGWTRSPLSFTLWRLLFVCWVLSSLEAFQSTRPDNCGCLPESAYH